MARCESQNHRPPRGWWGGGWKRVRHSHSHSHSHGVNESGGSHQLREPNNLKTTQPFTQTPGLGTPGGSHWSGATARVNGSAAGCTDRSGGVEAARPRAQRIPGTPHGDGTRAACDHRHVASTSARRALALLSFGRPACCCAHRSVKFTAIQNDWYHRESACVLTHRRPSSYPAAIEPCDHDEGHDDARHESSFAGGRPRHREQYKLDTPAFDKS